MISEEERQESMKSGNFYAFIPHKLKIDQLPQFDNFPFNIMYMRIREENGKKITGTAVYEPEFHTYKKEGSLSSMKYRNAYGGDCYVIISYDENAKKYHGEKFINGERRWITDGADDWKQFFIHLTMVGIAEGEQCKMGVVGV